MNISLNWLRDFVDWSGSVAELSDLLTRTGIEVASVTTRGADFPKVVVVQILESTQHPNADRLSVCRVDDGSGHPRQIVCGAKNYRVGDKVPCALPGAVLPGDFKIKVGKLRGVESEGMLCSAKELGLAEDAEGLLILSADAPVGAPISQLFPADSILELEITPNRGDWLSHLGVARELAAFSGRALKWQRLAAPVTRTEGAPVRIEAGDLCPFYALRCIRGVKVGPSPEWLRRRLETVGLRAINNIVDITNYVMLELGQPLHAFDAAKVGAGIVVRPAAAGEKFLALDGREYTLSPENLVIANEQAALALAGVMGGEDSGVTEATVDVVLESALFQPSSVRRTARALDLHSDSSHRFERGVDSAGILTASARATQLIVELAGGIAEEETFVAGALPEPPAPITLRTARVQSLLGLEVAPAEIRSALSGLGLSLAEDGSDVTAWSIPSHRLDLTREVDLIEEVARVVGIERIAGKVNAAPAEPGAADAAYDFQASLRQQLLGFGLSEARTSTLVSVQAGSAEAVRLKNPLGEDQAFLRTSLVPGLLAAVERNIRQGAPTIAIYEIGRTFHAQGGEETPVIALAFSGLATAQNWRGQAARPLDWHDAKGIVESLIPTGSVWTKVEAVAPFALAAEITLEGRKLGWLAQLSPSASRAIDAKGPVLAGELDLEALQALRTARTYQDISKFPAVTRDLAIVAPVTLPYGEIAATLGGAGEELLSAVEPFDIFTDPTGEKLPADRKSVAISLTFRASGRTLTGDEVNAACERLRRRLKDTLAVDFRE